MTTSTYTSLLSVGLGMIEETHILLDLWREGMDGPTLYRIALQSGRFSNISARRLRNIVIEGFAMRYLINSHAPAALLKALQETFSNGEFEQLLFIYTCRVHAILADFVREVYWVAYAAGRQMITNEDAQAFVLRANQDGKTTVPWSEGTIQRVAGHLTGCCADFGLLERGRLLERKILPCRIEPRVAAILAHDLHFKGQGDNSVLSHPDWALFGMARDDVLDEMKRLALKGLLIVQSAGGVTRVSWLYKSREELADVLAHG